MEITSIPNIDLLALDWATYCFEFRAHDSIDFPRYSSSLWRSLFGAALRRTVCVTRMDNCQQCMLAENCSYVYLFETRPPPARDRMRRYSNIPHPFVIKNKPSNTRITAGETFALEMVLFGRAADLLPYIIQSLMRAGKMGLFRERKQFTLQTVKLRRPDHTGQVVWSEGSSKIQPVEKKPISIPAAPTNAMTRLQLLTPFRYQQNNQIVRDDTFEFHHLYRSLSRRIAMLAYFHDQLDLDLSHANNIQRAEQIKIKQKKLHWMKWSRYSSRQKKTLSMAGIMGHIDIDLSAAKNLWSVLWLGQFCHAGKGTVMGLGEYQIELAASTAATDQLVNPANNTEIQHNMLEPANRRKAATQEQG